MNRPDNRQLAIIAVAGALCCAGCALWLPRSVAGNPRHRKGEAAPLPGALGMDPTEWAQLRRLQHENLRLRNRIKKAEASVPAEGAGSLASPRPTSIAVPDQWLRDRRSSRDPLEPSLSPSLVALFNLSEEERQELQEIFTGTLESIREFEFAHASKITDADGVVRIRVEAFDESGPAREWPFLSRMRDDIAGVVGAERAVFISEAFSTTTYGRHSNAALELSFELSDGRVNLVQGINAEGNGAATFRIPIDSKFAAESIIARYGQLLGMDSAEDLQQAVDGIVASPGNLKEQPQTPRP